MADYIAYGRTNEFCVTDEEKFKKLLKGFPSGTQIDISIDDHNVIRHFIGSLNGPLEWYKAASDVPDIKEMIINETDFYDRNGELIPAGTDLDNCEELYDKDGNLLFDRFDPDDGDCDLTNFVKKLQNILPPKEAFVYIEAGHERLRYVGGYAIFATNCNIESTSFEKWAENLAVSRGINKLQWD